MKRFLQALSGNIYRDDIVFIKTNRLHKCTIQQIHSDGYVAVIKNVNGVNYYHLHNGEEMKKLRWQTLKKQWKELVKIDKLIIKTKRLWKTS